METTVTIAGRPVRLKATAALPRIYRIKYRRDIIQDFQVANKEIQRRKKELLEADPEADPNAIDVPMEVLELFEHMAFIMARHADPEGTPTDEDEWLGLFPPMSIYQLIEVVSALWQGNMESLLEAKKKLTAAAEAASTET